MTFVGAFLSSNHFFREIAGVSARLSDPDEEDFSGGLGEKKLTESSVVSGKFGSSFC